MAFRIVIIAAGGSGSRMQSDLPKQYMLLDGLPVMMHSITAFAAIADLFVVVLHPDMRTLWEEQCRTYQFSIPHIVVDGGPSRFQSVKKGLQHIIDTVDQAQLSDAVIAIHDAARPLVHPDLIRKSYALAEGQQGNCLAIPSSNSIRLGSDTESTAVDRSRVWQIQTPQTFPATQLMESYQQEESILFTDDASVVELAGHRIHMLESHPSNIKLTFQEDFEIASVYLRAQRQ